MSQHFIEELRFPRQLYQNQTVETTDEPYDTFEKIFIRKHLFFKSLRNFGSIIDIQDKICFIQSDVILFQNDT